jgi:hypothetical protein
MEEPRPRHLVHPSLAVDSKNRLAAVVQSETVVGVCLKRLGEEAVDPILYSLRLNSETWATVIRSQDNVFFITCSGLVPGEDPPVVSNPSDQEAVHMAIEIGLAIWPEWGSQLRDRFTPKRPIALHLVGQPLEA